MITPFVILCDSGEQKPWSFDGIALDSADAKKSKTEFYQPRLKRAFIGQSQGDYCIEEDHGLCHIERKSVEDCVSTVLDWEHKERWENTLEFLDSIDSAAVVVEGTLQQCIAAVKGCDSPDLIQKALRLKQLNGTPIEKTVKYKKPEVDRRKSFFREVISEQQRFPNVCWMFADDRRLAEVFTFRWMVRYFMKARDMKKLS